MAVLSLKDGSVETILQPEDFQYLLDDYLGYDAAKYFQRLIEKYESQIKEANDETNSDLTSYESSLESNTRAFQDIEELCRSMVSEFNLEEGRNKLATLRPWYKRIAEIITIINNQI
jgi:hypothetical protein